jgi:endonuclease YncB( thermonuclease family)
LLAKEWLKKHVDDSIIISTHVDNEKGKFGRILGTVWKDGNNINEQMITEGHAVSYHGQNKDDVQAAHMANRQLLKEKGIA